MLRTLSLSFVLAATFFVASVVEISAATLTYTNGLRLWLRADADAYSDAGTTAAINGSTVQQWNDQLIGSNITADNATQGTAGNRPTYVTNAINGLPVLRFDAGTTSQLGDYLDGASLLSGDAARTVFIVGSSNSGIANISLFEFNRDSTPGNGELYRITPEAAVRVTAGNQVFDTPLSTSAQILTISNATGEGVADIVATLNGLTLGTLPSVAQVLATGTDGYRIAGAHDLNVAQDFDGDIAEILVFNSELTPEQFNSVGYYLETKYNLNTAFTMPPVPEPATCTLLGLGIVLLHVRRRRTEKVNRS